MSSKRAWIVLPDPLSIRIFVDTGIVSGLYERLDGELAVVFLVSREAAAEWLDRLPDLPVLVRRGAHGSARASRSARWPGSTPGSTASSATTRSRSA